MKKAGLLFGIFLLLLSMSTFQASADSINLNEKELDQEFEKILEDIPEGEYISDDESEIIFNTTRSKYIPRAGDILYTPNTQCKGDKCKGISGHVGIVNTTNASVIHTSGKGDTSSVISIGNWFIDYPKTIVIRPNDSTKGKKAAEWARSYYTLGGDGTKKPYKITFEGDLTKSLSTKTTYCSLIVWQAYYFGANQFLSVGDPIPPIGFVNFASYHNMTNHMKIGY